uniref:Predicted protein n=1 Tax=Hordeum vulgare subsp. vulgare TaxID=112509 RepID=F2DYG7_HORVV|nr:predicted protein [Hordeum vulgare subsp. vulgare]
MATKPLVGSPPSASPAAQSTPNPGLPTGVAAQGTPTPGTSSGSGGAGGAAQVPDGGPKSGSREYICFSLLTQLS